MTDNELAITMYLEGCKTRASLDGDTKTEQLLTKILKQIDLIVKEQPLTIKTKAGNCELCSEYTIKLIREKYCRRCFDQFIED